MPSDTGLTMTMTDPGDIQEVEATNPTIQGPSGLEITRSGCDWRVVLPPCTYTTDDLVQRVRWFGHEVDHIGQLNIRGLGSNAREENTIVFVSDMPMAQPESPAYVTEPVYAPLRQYASPRQDSPVGRRRPSPWTVAVDPEPAREEAWRSVVMETTYNGVGIDDGYGYDEYTIELRLDDRFASFPYRERTRAGGRRDELGLMPVLRTLVRRGQWAERWTYEEWCIEMDRRTDCVGSRRRHAEAVEQAAEIRRVLGDKYAVIVDELGLY